MHLKYKCPNSKVTSFRYSPSKLTVMRISMLILSWNLHLESDSSVWVACKQNTQSNSKCNFIFLNSCIFLAEKKLMILIINGVLSTE